MTFSSQAFMKRDDIRGIYPTQLNGRTAECLGQAACELLKSHGIEAPVIAVGHDCRRGNLEIPHPFVLENLHDYEYHACNQRKYL